MQAPANETVRRRNIIQRFIFEQHQANITLADLARRLNLSESRAAHVVREACGRSFIELLAEARLRTAAGLLRHAELPVLKVCHASGFRDTSHFHRAFRKHFGVTPLQYRKGLEP